MPAGIIQHYGIKGMKWGVRRKRPPNSKDYEESRSLAKLGAPRLTTAQLAAVNKRLNLEQNFKRMNPTDRGAAERLVSKFLSQYGNLMVAGLAGMLTSLTLARIKKNLEDK